MPTWLSWLPAFLLAIFKWAFGGRQEAEGEALGSAEAQRDSAEQELSDAETAHRARDGVVIDAGSVRDDSANDGPRSR